VERATAAQENEQQAQHHEAFGRFAVINRRKTEVFPLNTHESCSEMLRFISVERAMQGGSPQKLIAGEGSSELESEDPKRRISNKREEQNPP
jgi:hypothetical protein